MRSKAMDSMQVLGSIFTGAKAGARCTQASRAGELSKVDAASLCLPPHLRHEGDIGTQSSQSESQKQLFNS